MRPPFDRILLEKLETFRRTAEEIDTEVVSQLSSQLQGVYGLNTGVGRQLRNEINEALRAIEHIKSLAALMEKRGKEI